MWASENDIKQENLEQIKAAFKCAYTRWLLGGRRVTYGCQSRIQGYVVGFCRRYARPETWVAVASGVGLDVTRCRWVVTVV